jgi:hypothetical protein
MSFHVKENHVMNIKPQDIVLRVFCLLRKDFTVALLENNLEKTKSSKVFKPES